MATESQLSQNGNHAITIDTTDIFNGDMAGQLLTITDRTVTALTFKLARVNSPSGNLYFEIRDNSAYPGVTLVSKLLSTAASISVNATDYTATFDTPIYVNAEVRILVRIDGGNVSDYVVSYQQNSDVKASENAFWSDNTPGSWNNQTSIDRYYIYTYTAGDVTLDPTVTTQTPDPIADTTATGKGTVVTVGGATNYGHVWSVKATNSNPLIGGTGVTNVAKGSAPSVGAFTSSFTGLTAAQVHVTKAYIISPNGTYYGDAVEFTTTGVTIPSVTTQACTSVTDSNAVGNGNLVSAGGYTISERGHVWATHHVPTIADSSATTAGGTLGAYTSAITPLLVNTVYYVMAYCKTSTGLYFYGAEVTLTTSGGLPIVTTQLVTAITTTTATGNLTLVNNGGSTITQYGVCWKTSTGPTVSDDHTSEGAYSATFPKAMTSAMSELLPNTLHYLRAYATNSTGTAYGAEVTFTTKITGAPTVTTDDIFAMTYTTATYRGTIVDLGASAVTSHGFYRGTAANPTVANTTVLDDGAQAIGQYSSDDTGLTAGTTYYFRAYAINTQGTAYGDNIEFVAGRPTIGSITYFSPADQFTRVSGIQRMSRPGSFYQTVLLLGGTSTTYVSPISSGEPSSSVTSQVSGQGLTQAAYEAWLVNNSIEGILKVFGHLPTYTEWVKFIQSGGVSILGQGPLR